MSKGTILAAACASLALAACQQGAGEEEVAALRAEMTALQDRDAIQDLLFGYYAKLGSEGAHDLSEYFTEDAVFELNGIVMNGRDEIQAIYDRSSGNDEGAGPDVPPEMQEVHLTLLNNPIVKVDGDTATARMIWSGTVNETAFAKPEFFDQGREYDKFVKQNGKWLIQKRVIIADGFLPRSMADRWERKWDYDIDSE